MLELVEEYNEVRVLGVARRLSFSQTEVLALLLKHPDRGVRYQTIINTLWGPHNSREVPMTRGRHRLPNSLTVLMCVLRKKLSDVADIKAVDSAGKPIPRGYWEGAGYRLFMKPIREKGK